MSFVVSRGGTFPSSLWYPRHCFPSGRWGKDHSLRKQSGNPAQDRSFGPLMELSGGWDTFTQCLSLDTSLAPLHFAVLWFGSPGRYRASKVACRLWRAVCPHCCARSWGWEGSCRVKFQAYQNRKNSQHTGSKRLPCPA